MATETEKRAIEDSQGSKVEDSLGSKVISSIAELPPVFHPVSPIVLESPTDFLGDTDECYQATRIVETTPLSHISMPTVADDEFGEECHFFVTKMFNDVFDFSVTQPSLRGKKLHVWNKLNHWPRRCKKCAQLPVYPGTAKGLCDFCHLDESLPNLVEKGIIKKQFFAELCSTIKSYLIYAITSSARALGDALGTAFVAKIKEAWQAFLAQLPSACVTVFSLSVAVLLVVIICKVASSFAGITLTAITMALKALAEAGLSFCGSVLTSLHNIVSARSNPVSKPELAPTVVSESGIADFGTNPGVQLLAALITTISPLAGGGYSAAAGLKALTSARSVLVGVGVMKVSLDTLVAKLPAFCSDFMWENFRVGLVDVEEADKLYIASAVDLLANIERTPLLMNELSTCQRVLAISKRLTEMHVYSISTNPTAASRILAKLVKDYNVFVPKANKLMSTRDRRVEPVGIWLYSEPGVGKSHSMSALAGELFPHIPAAMRMYSPSLGVSYENGYSGEPLYFMDEPTAMGGETMKMTFAKMLDYLGVKPVNVNMANLEDKNTMFTSRLVIACANTSLDRPLGMADDNALRRRFSVCEVTLKPEWMRPNDGAFDTGKLRNMLANGSLSLDESAKQPWQVYKPKVFRKTNSVGNRYTPLCDEQGREIAWSFTQFTAHVASELQKNQVSFENTISVEERAERQRPVSNIKAWQDDGAVTLLPPPLAMVEGSLEKAAFEADAYPEFKDYSKEIIDFGDDEVFDRMMGQPVGTMAAENAAHRAHAGGFAYMSSSSSSIVLEMAGANSRARAAEYRKTKDKERVESKKADLPIEGDGDDAPPRCDHIKIQEEAQAWRLRCMASQGSSEHNIQHGDARLVSWGMSRYRLKMKEKLGVLSLAMYEMLWKYHITTFSEKWRTRIYKILGVGAFAGVALLIYRGLIGQAEEVCAIVDEKTDGAKSVPRMTRKPVARRPAKARVARPHIVQSTRDNPVSTDALGEDSTLLPGLDDGIRNSIFGNIVKVTVPSGGNYGYYCCGSFLITTLHTFMDGPDHLAEGTEFNVTRSSGETVTISFCAANFGTMPQTDAGRMDICIYNTRGAFPAFKDIRKFYAKPADTKRIWDKDFYLTHMGKYEKLVGLRNVRTLMQHGQLYSNNFLSYEACTYYGDCGALIIAPNKGSTAVIVGHHTSKNTATNRSMAQVVDRDLVDALIACFSEKPDPHVECPIALDEIKHSCLVPRGRQPLGRISDRSLVGGLPTKTKYRRSPIAHLAPFCNVDMDPAILRTPTMSGYSIIVRRKEKYVDSMQATTFDPVYLDQARASLESMLAPIYQVGKGGLCTWSEVLNGKKDPKSNYPTLSDYPRNTSIGFPDQATLKKSDVILRGEDGLYYLEEAYAKRLLETEEKFLTEGCSFVFESVQKDEILPRAKIEAIDTRCITVCPMIYNLLLKKYFGAYADACMQCIGQTPYSVGMDVQSSDWDTMIKRLLANAPNGFDGDYKGFEYMHTHQAFDSFLDHIEDYYDRVSGEEVPEDDKTMRRRLLRAAQHCNIKIGPVVHATSSELASGIWLTLMINSFFSALYLLYAYYALADEVEERRPYANTTACIDHVAIVVMGDDNMTSVAPEIENWFNGANVQRALAAVGRGFTPSAKGTEFEENRAILKLGYLSCFTRVANIKGFPNVDYWCIMNLNTIHRQCTFNTLQDDDDALATGFNNALRDYWPYGREEFEAFRRITLEACDSVGYPVSPISYADEYQRRLNTENQKRVISQGFGGDAFQSVGRIYKLRHFTSQEWVRFFSTVTIAAQEEAPHPASFKLSEIFSGHPIRESIERSTAADRAAALLDVYDGQTSIGEWLLDAGITSTAGLSCVGKGDQAVMIDGNNRLMAVRMACDALRIPQEDLAWNMPAHHERKGPLRILWECRSTPSPTTCPYCSCEDCDCEAVVSNFYSEFPYSTEADDHCIVLEMEVAVHDNDDHVTQVVSPAPGGETVKPSAADLEPLSSILDIAKRYGTVVRSKVITAGSAPALGVISGALKDSGAIISAPSSFVLDMYAMFAGSIRVMVYSPYETVCGASVSTAIPVLEVAEGVLRSGLLPYGQLSSNVNYQGYQIPFLSRFNGVLIPRTGLEAVTDGYSCGVFNFSPLDAEDSGTWDPRIMAAIGDDAMVWGLYRVPRQIVSGAFHPHNDKADDVPSALRYTHDPSEPAVTIKQEWLLNQSYPAYHQTASDGVQVTVVEIPTSILTDAELTNAGYPFPSGNRHVIANWKPTQAANLSNLVSFPGSVVGRLGIVGPSEVDSFTATPVGYSFTRTDGVQAVDVATEFVFDYTNYDKLSFRTLMGIPATDVVVPNGSSVTKSFPSPATQVLGDITFWPICKNKGILASISAANPFVHVPKTTSLFQNDHIVSEMEKAAGVGVTVIEDGVTNASNVARIPTSMMPPTMEGGDYSYKDLMSRQTKLDTIAWEQTAAPLSVLASYTSPFELFKGPMSRLIKRFQFFRGDVVFRFNVQSPPFHSGKVIASFLPLRSDGASRTEHTSSTTNLTLNQHCILFAGDNSAVELRIPWLHIKSMLEPNNATGEVPLGTLSLVVVNPLLTGPDNPDAVQISVFVHFENVELKVLRSNADIVSEMGLFSDLGENVRKVVKGTVDVVSSVSKIVGLVRDKPNVGQSAEAAIRQGLPYIANGVGVEQNLVLSMYPDEVVSPSQGMVGTVVNETHVRYMYSKFTQFQSYTASDSLVFGDVICSGNICPVQKLDKLAFGDSAQESLLGYLSSYHTFWTGALELKFEFVGTRYHKMRFVFCYHYGTQSDRLVGEDAMQQFIVLYDYSYDNPTMTVSLPWRSPTSTLKVPPGSEVTQGVHSGGEWSLRVDAPMVAMESVADVIGVNVFIRGGEGFKLTGVYETSVDYTSLRLGEQSL